MPEAGRHENVQEYEDVSGDEEEIMRCGGSF